MSQARSKQSAMAAAAGLLIFGVGCQAGDEVLGASCTRNEEVTSESGLVSVDLECGDGAEAAHGDVLVVQYTATLDDGTEFDSAAADDPYEFLLESDKVIAGWNEGLDGMQVGGTRQLVIPPDLAYGADGLAGRIPPDSTITYVVTLLDVKTDP
jgi:FKBP-type peptidyl-prolyl cis-trans isomerase FkpA